MPDLRAPRLAPITGPDLADVGTFLHDHLDPRITARAWSAAIVPTWRVGAPNHGFLLRRPGPAESDPAPAGGVTGDVTGEPTGEVVGVQLAFYSRRRVEGEWVRFCNLGAWCVLAEHRSHGLRLLRAALAQPDYHFTDLSPSGSVVELNTRLRFQRLDTTTALVPPVGFPRLTRRPTRVPRQGRAARVETDPEVLEATLEGTDLQVYLDHQRAAATLHLLLVAGEESSYVVLRRDRRRGLPLFASVLHASDPGVVRRHATTLARHLLVHHGVPFVLVELRRLDGPPVGGVVLRTSRPKMYRSTLPPGAIDDLYSELALVAW